MYRYTIIRTSFLLIACGSFLLSCKKAPADSSLAFPIDLSAYQITKVADTRLFTKKGEITDVETITKFVKGNSLFSVEKTPNLSILALATLRITSKDSAYFGGSTSLQYGMKRNAEQFIFTSRKLAYSTSVPNNVIVGLGKYQSEKTNAPKGTYQSYDVKVAYGYFRELRFPLFSYRLSQSNSTGTNTSRSIISGVLINEFNTNIIAKLGDSDTLAIKQYQTVAR